MKIVVFTNKCSHCAEILKACSNEGINFSAIIVEKPTAGSMKKKLWRTLRSLGLRELLNVLFQRIKRQLRKHQEAWRSDRFYKAFSDTVVSVDNFNGVHCEQTVKDIAPDVIVLGGSRILRNNIINIPAIGILNAHPGLLPAYRGVDVIPWALLNGDDVGVTVHFVDKGVDTGEICVQEKLSLKKDDTIVKLKKRAEELAGKLMARVLQNIIRDGTCDTIQNPKLKGNQFYKMDSKKLKEAERQLQERIKNVR